MALTKANWIDLVRHNLAGGDTPAELRGEYHPRIIEKLIAIAFDSLLNSNNTKKDDLRDELGQDNWKYSAMTKVYFVEIKKDTDRDRYYSDLPVTPMAINNNQGIRMVCYKKEEASQFIPRRLEDLFLMEGLDVNTLGGMTFYTLEGINKLYYSGDISGCMNGKEIMMKLAVGFDELEDTDVVGIPDGKDLEIMGLVREILMTNPPQDITNDAAAIQTTK